MKTSNRARIQTSYTDWFQKAMNAGYSPAEADGIFRKWRSLGLRVWNVGGK